MMSGKGTIYGLSMDYVGLLWKIYGVCGFLYGMNVCFLFVMEWKWDYIMTSFWEYKGNIVDDM